MILKQKITPKKNNEIIQTFIFDNYYSNTTDIIINRLLQLHKMEKDNLNSLICRPFHGDSLFCFVLIIGLYEMLTKPGGFKKIIRILLIITLLGTQFSYLIPINDFYFGVYNTAWFSAIIALILITVKFLKAIIKTKKRNYPKIISF